MTVVSERIGQFFHEGSRLEFTEYGGTRDGVNRWVILLQGQLIPRRMHQPLARAIAGAGYHVVTLDLLGHGRSDRPDDPLVYSTTAFAEQVVHLMDELGIDDAVVGGMSLGANVSLEVAVLVPDRVRGLLLEMPFLDNAVNAGLVAFVPLMFTARYLPFAVTAVRRTTRLVPRGLVPFWAGIVLDTLAQQPGAMAAALHGMIFGRIAPPAKVRETLEMPALVVGHPRDPIHPAADAAMLAEELPRSEFIEAESFLEWRLRPDRLDARAIEFVDKVFADGAQVARRTRNIRST